MRRLLRNGHPIKDGTIVTGKQLTLKHAAPAPYSTHQTTSPHPRQIDLTASNIIDAIGSRRRLKHGKSISLNLEEASRRRRLDSLQQRASLPSNNSESPRCDMHSTISHPRR
jgi:hypothetical protein